MDRDNSRLEGEVRHFVPVVIRNTFTMHSSHTRGGHLRLDLRLADESPPGERWRDRKNGGRDPGRHPRSIRFDCHNEESEEVVPHTVVLPSEGAVAICVFDFDKTLAIKHVGQFDVSSTAEERCFGGADRVRALTEMFEAIQSAGAEIHICTRNSIHVVQKSLGPRCQQGWGPNQGGIGLLSSVKSIVGLENMSWDMPKSRAIHGQIAQGTANNRILFVDDDANNTNEVQTNIPGCTVLHVKGKGMTLEDMTFVKNWVVGAAAESLRVQNTDKEINDENYCGGVLETKNMGKIEPSQTSPP